MEKIEVIHGLVAPLDRANVDTDAIMPKQFLKSIKRTGFGQFLFDEWRYLDHGELGMDCSTRPLNPQFSLNKARFKGASILLTQDNFGCGSSREHAVWGLYEYGFRAIIAPSFAEIFFSNCTKNSLLPVVLPKDDVEMLFAALEKEEGFKLEINLKEQTVILSNQKVMTFSIDPAVKEKLLNGLDDIGLTLKSQDKIIAYEKMRASKEPWVFDVT